jgi:hypothetical protein
MSDTTNERGKGDHRHFQGGDTVYAFSTVERLIADFWSDVHRLRGPSPQWRRRRSRCAGERADQPSFTMMAF